jgi:PDZ domain-containing secreted protein
MSYLTIGLVIVFLYILMVRHIRYYQSRPRPEIKVKVCADIKGGDGPLLATTIQKPKATRKACITLTLKSDQEVSNM